MRTGEALYLYLYNIEWAGLYILYIRKECYSQAYKFTMTDITTTTTIIPDNEWNELLLPATDTTISNLSWRKFREKIVHNVHLMDKFFRNDNEVLADVIPNFLYNQHDNIIKSLEWVIEKKNSTHKLVQILLNSCLRVPFDSTINSTTEPNIDLLLTCLNHQQRINEEIEIEKEKEKDSITKNFGEFKRLNITEAIHHRHRHLLFLEEKQQQQQLSQQFWEFVAKTLYEIVFSEMEADNEENFCFTLWQRYFMNSGTDTPPRTVSELCDNILRFIIDSLPKSQLDKHRSAITSVVYNSFLIRYELAFLGGVEFFVNNNNNNNNILKSQKTTLRLIQIMKNLREGLTNSSSVLWQILKTTLPHFKQIRDDNDDDDDNNNREYNLRAICDDEFSSIYHRFYNRSEKEEEENKYDNSLYNSSNSNSNSSSSSEEEEEEEEEEEKEIAIAKRKRKKINISNKKIKTEEKFTAWLNGPIYSLAGSSDATFWQKGTVVDKIITSVFNDVKDNRLASYIYRCLALFQLTQDFQYRNAGERAVIGVWFDQLLAHDNFNDKIDTSNIPPLEKDELKLTIHTRLCTNDLLAKFLYYPNNNNNFPLTKKFGEFLSNWLSTFIHDAKLFSTAEMGCLILSSILGNSPILELVKPKILNYFSKFSQYAICDSESVALTRQFIPFKNSSKVRTRKWEYSSNVFEYAPDEFENNMVALVPYKSNYPATYIRIESKEKAIKWAIAIMMRNCYFVLNERHINEQLFDLQSDLLLCYNEYNFIMPLDLVIDIHSGFLCVWFDKECYIHSLQQLENIVWLEQNNQPGYHFMGAMCSVFFRMIFNIANYEIPSTMDVDRLFLSTEDYGYDNLSTIFFIPPLPTKSKTKIEKKDVNNVFTELVNMVSKYQMLDYAGDMRYNDRDVESIFAVIPLANDKPIIDGGSKFIRNCLKEKEEEKEKKEFELITKSTKEYLADLRIALKGKPYP